MLKLPKTGLGPKDFVCCRESGRRRVLSNLLDWERRNFSGGFLLSSAGQTKARTASRMLDAELHRCLSTHQVHKVPINPAESTATPTAASEECRGQRGVMQTRSLRTWSLTEMPWPAA